MSLLSDQEFEHEEQFLPSTVRPSSLGGCSPTQCRPEPWFQAPAQNHAWQAMPQHAPTAVEPRQHSYSPEGSIPPRTSSRSEIALHTLAPTNTSLHMTEHIAHIPTCHQLTAIYPPYPISAPDQRYVVARDKLRHVTSTDLAIQITDPRYRDLI